MEKRIGRVTFMINRVMADQMRAQAQWFPVLSVTGPRQSGKSTLVKSVFDSYEYVNLEDPQLRREALEDPVGFIRTRPARLIIDEVQYAPELFSVIQVVSDEREEAGQYILSGSQNFLLTKRIGQSLAGRVGLLKLLPVSYEECRGYDPACTSESFMFTGGYPRLLSTGMPASLFFSSYLDTYIERDVADYLDVRNLTAFRRFVQLCALNAGNLMNYSSLARDADIDARTAKAWLSMLDASYITFALHPYYRNPGKRLTKSPKLYFYDTGLLCYLLGISSSEQLVSSEYFGAVCENFIVAETQKKHLNRGVRPELYFYRDDRKIEVDLLDFTDARARKLVEVKSGQTYRDAHARHLQTVGVELEVPAADRYVVSRVEHGFRASAATVSTYDEWLLG